jgi:hypothetical protein
MTKKTIKHPSADVGLIFTAYNLRRIFNLIDENLLKQYLKTKALFFEDIKGYFNAFYAFYASIILFLIDIFSVKNKIIVS